MAGNSGNSAAGPITGKSEADKVKDIIRRSEEGNRSIYSMAIDIEDDYQFAISATRELDLLKDSDVIAKKYGFKGNDFEFMQSTLRSSGKSKGTGPINSTDIKDFAAFRVLLKESYIEGKPWDEVVTNFIKYGEKKPGKKSPYNPIYSKDISTALKLIDSTDAENILSDTYFKTFGQYPTADLISKFKSSYSAEVKRQKTTITSESITKNVPVLNSKGKATFNKDGSPVMKAIKTSTESTTGRGFTEDEQKDFLAQYIVDTSPKGAFDAATIGGAAKTYYDMLTNVHSANYEDAPNIAELTPVIKSLLQATDQGVIDEITKKYQTDVRTRVGTKFMGTSEYVKSGGDAKSIIEPILKSLSTTLETNIDQNDKLAIKLLNFQGSDGKFRLPNQYEIDEAVKSDSRFLKTSTSKNEAVNLFQSLKGALA